MARDLVAESVAGITCQHGHPQPMYCHPCMWEVDAQKEREAELAAANAALHDENADLRARLRRLGADD